MSSEPVVDVIIAVHNGERPVERAVASVLGGSLVPVRVTVVAHNIEPAVVVERLGDLADDDSVRVIALGDGVRSPANAYNHGLDAATAEYVSIIGSDDELERGALDAWVELAERTRADAVIAPIVRDGGGGVPTPRVRGRRVARPLDLDRDRLFERSAPLGLQRRAETTHLRYASGLPRGVDQSYGLRLWRDHRVVFDPTTPAYREHADQSDRVTHVFGPLREDFAYLDDVVDVLDSLSPTLRTAATAKLIRVHLLPAVRNRKTRAKLSQSDLEDARRILQRLLLHAPRARGLLPRAADEEIGALLTSELRRGPHLPRRLSLILPRDLRKSLHRHGPLRSELAGRRVARRVAAAVRRRSMSVPREPDTRAPLRVVVLSPGGSADAIRLRDEARATVIGWKGSRVDLEVAVAPAWSQTLQRTLGSSFPAQLVLRLIGADAATRFAVSIRRSPSALAALADADVVIAAEADAVLAAWQRGRAGRQVAVEYGFAAGDSRIRREVRR